MTRTAAALGSVVAMLLSACSNDDSSNQVDSSGPSSPTAADDADVTFVTVAAGVEAQCARDAHVLGWAVPCPSVLPGSGDPVMCEPSCVYTGGEPPVPMFYLSVSDFPGPSPDGPNTVRHLVLVAFPRGAESVLDPPCPDAQPLPDLDTKLGELELFHCGDGLQDEDLIRHGEAINRNHDVVRWYRNGIAYAVSLHQSGLNTREILRRVAEGIEYVP